MTTPPAGLVSVVVPVYDEAPRLARSLARLVARVDGWAFDAELLAIAGARGGRVAEIGVRWSDGGESRASSKVRWLPAVARSLADLGRIALWRLRGDWSALAPESAREAPVARGAAARASWRPS